MKEIDLHGKNQTEAQIYLSQQLLLFKLQGEGAVRIITGQGHHSKSGESVLRKKVPKWLAGVKFNKIVRTISLDLDNPGAIIAHLTLRNKSKFKSLRLL